MTLNAHNLLDDSCVRVGLKHEPDHYSEAFQEVSCDAGTTIYSEAWSSKVVMSTAGDDDPFTMVTSSNKHCHKQQVQQGSLNFDYVGLQLVCETCGWCNHDFTQEAQQDKVFCVGKYM
jgi:hypothetical protein